MVTVVRPDTDGEAAASGAPSSAKPKQKARLVLFEDRHLPGVLSLYGRVFGADAAVTYEARWRWSLRDNLFPENTPAWVLEAGDEVVGFLGTVPQPYVIGGETIIAYATADYMVDERYRFHGVSLMRQFFKECENCITADDMAATIKVTTWLGAKEIGLMRRYVKVLDARVLAERERFAKVPSFALRPLTAALKLADMLTRAASRGRVMPLDAFDERFDRFFERLSRSTSATVRRDSKFLEWRYGPSSPHAGRHIAAVLDNDGELAGYVIYHLASGPDRTGYVLDLQVLPEAGSDTASRLLGHAISDLRRMGAWTVRFYGLVPDDSPQRAALKRWRFSPRTGHRFLVRLANEDLSQVAQDAGNWNFMYGDSEASHSVP